MTAEAPAVGVVIPTLNEAANLPGILSDIHRLSAPTDILVVDGGSEDDTLDVARRGGARTIEAPRGRGRQMNAGAMGVAGEWLCFLHADVRMPTAARLELERLLSDGSAEAATWRFAIAASGVWPRVMEFGAHIRDRLGGLPYGDQGLIVRRALFQSLGGFPELPIMEDVAMVRALRRQTAVARLSAPISVSPRRWLREGPYRTWLRNAALLAGFLAGVDPKRLERWYAPERS